MGSLSPFGKQKGYRGKKVILLQEKQYKDALNPHGLEKAKANHNTHGMLFQREPVHVVIENGKFVNLICLRERQDHYLNRRYGV